MTKWYLLEELWPWNNIYSSFMYTSNNIKWQQKQQLNKSIKPLKENTQLKKREKTHKKNKQLKKRKKTHMENKQLKMRKKTHNEKSN